MIVRPPSLNRMADRPRVGSIVAGTLNPELLVEMRVGSRVDFDIAMV